MRQINNACPLCEYQKTKPAVTYFFCPNCHLHYKKPEVQLTKEAEKLRYLEHNNDVSDKRYLNYLDGLFSHMPKNIEGPILDFGCGPSKGLEALIEKKELNFEVHSFDPFYFSEGLVNGLKYRSIYASECFEHFTNPAKTIEFIAGLQDFQSVLAIRTSLYSYSENGPLEDWWYFKDPTHISFYSEKTILWLSEKYNYQINSIQNPFVILIKNKPIEYPIEYVSQKKI